MATIKALEAIESMDNKVINPCTATIFTDNGVIMTISIPVRTIVTLAGFMECK
jgi:hypothetical protein